MGFQRGHLSLVQQETKNSYTKSLCHALGEVIGIQPDHVDTYLRRRGIDDDALTLADELESLTERARRNGSEEAANCFEHARCAVEDGKDEL